MDRRFRDIAKIPQLFHPSHERAITDARAADEPVFRWGNEIRRSAHARKRKRESPVPFQAGAGQVSPPEAHFRGTRVEYREFPRGAKERLSPTTFGCRHRKSPPTPPGRGGAVASAHLRERRSGRERPQGGSVTSPSASVTFPLPFGRALIPIDEYYAKAHRRRPGLKVPPGETCRGVTSASARRLPPRRNSRIPPRGNAQYSAGGTSIARGRVPPATKD